VKVVLKPHESVHSALRKLKKQLERSGLMRELRRREHYIKPSVQRRQDKARRKRNMEKGNHVNGEAVARRQSGDNMLPSW